MSIFIVAFIWLLFFVSVPEHVHSLGIKLRKGDPSKIGTDKEDEQGKMDPKDASLLKASAEGEVELVKQYLAAGANLEIRDPKIGNTALIWASLHGHVNVMKYLISKGANLEALSDDGHKTAVLLATYNGHLDAVVYLLQQGARINHANSRGDTSISIASYRNYTAIVEALLLRRADITITTKEHKYTPLHIAAHKGHVQVMDLLISDGMAVDKVINAPDSSGNTPFMIAAEQGKTETVRFMLGKAAAEAGVKLHATQKTTGSNALMLAAAKGHEETVDLLLDDDRILSAINQKNSRKITALMEAAGACKLGTIRLLLTKGASTQLTDSKGYDAMEIAKRADCPAAVTLLSEFLRLHPQAPLPSGTTEADAEEAAAEAEAEAAAVPREKSKSAPRPAGIKRRKPKSRRDQTQAKRSKTDEHSRDEL